jgi:hypothetical protein
VARRELEVTQGKQAASKFLEGTKRKFGKRVEKYEQLRKRTLLP